MPTSTTPPPPKSGSGQFIGAALLMLLLMGGLIYWKVYASDDKSGPSPALTAVTSLPTGPTVDQVVPPPPPPPTASGTEDAGVATTAKKATTGFTGTGCSRCGKCSGEPAPSFSSVLRSRASLAQRCYEKALAQQETLQGKVSVSLCVGVGGAVCNANIAKDTLGSPLVAQCVLNIYRSTTFPSPKNGCVDAEVPLNFLPEKK